MTKSEFPRLVKPEVYVVDVKNDDVVKYFDILHGFYCQATSFDGIPFTGRFAGIEMDSDGRRVGVALREFSTFDMKTWFVEKDRFLLPSLAEFVDGAVEARTLFHLPEPVIPEEYRYVIQ